MNQLNIIFEDNHLLVVNKEAEVVSQGALPGQTSLIDLAKAYEAHNDFTAGGELRESARRLRGIEERIRQAHTAGVEGRPLETV